LGEAIGVYADPPKLHSTQLILAGRRFTTIIPSIAKKDLRF